MPLAPAQNDNLHLRSEEVQEIISRPPAWLIRWGITLVFLMLTLLIGLSFLIRYPDFVEAKVLVTTVDPTERIAARISGQIETLFVKNGEKVSMGQPLAGIKSTAKMEDVLFLKATLEQEPFIKDNDFLFPVELLTELVLGEIGLPFLEFERSYMEYRLLGELQPYDGQLEGNKISIGEIKNRIQSQTAQKALLDRRLNLAKIDYERNKGLHRDGIIADRDFEFKEMEYLQMEEQVNQMAISISQLHEALSTANQTVRSTNINKEEEETRSLKALIQSYQGLKRSLRDWEYTYLVKSSINGIVSFQKVWGANQQVNLGELVFTVLPENKAELMGAMKISPQNAGKVSVGQKVLIKLDNYPFQEFGALIGKISSISVSPDDEFNYLVYASLPNGTTTSFDREIPFNQELLGNAEIITEELSVAERLFFKFRSIMVY
ncbi:HlyD family secretion protein [Cecembia lonarensis]|uniref:Type I secretion membrane fusion protein, HlyD family n=1 Tax=Cecembia lonarensis (strain CCUG 58316 / KCTC 22772 / LW9) TaxID=1225176 RepID=K1KVA8_CECL9|nr:HlyD family efflux transporter periplasmic adaptor subunit [Cecembia lonarensis]EKB48110.1 type I secretion membrane fusion protein, HlyD family [Cecembia lonarensis LW9]